MNREIKFRVWNMGRKKWGEFETFVGEGYCGLEEYHENLIVQQYTGLKDKNGKEIYEGDIVAVGFGEHKGALGKVIFDYGAYMLEPQYGGVFMDTYKSCLYGEVVGNVFENPDIMTQNE